MVVDDVVFKEEDKGLKGVYCNTHTCLGTNSA